jgi:lipoyl synthase
MGERSALAPAPRRASIARPSPRPDVSRRTGSPLHVRWLGTVPYREALSLQHGLFVHGADGHLLLCEHPHVFTLGARGDLDHLLVEPDAVGAEVVHVDRGGDITYHGPGQLVGYPIVNVAGRRGGGMADTAAHVAAVEQVVIDTLAALGLEDCGRLAEFPGVWVQPDGPAPRKIAAVGVRLSRGRSMHGFALNVDPDMSFFEAIVPCGIVGRQVTSLRSEGIDADMRAVADAVATVATERWGGLGSTRHDVAWRHRPEDLSAFSRGEGPGAVPRPVTAGDVPEAASPPSSGVSVRLRGRLDAAGVEAGLEIGARKPEWMRVKADMGPEYRRIKSVMRDLDLVTVCEEAGCPNIFDCWNDGTATFMILGERCTRACGFCLVDTRKPLEPDPDEPARVADAVERMNLRHAVVTMVARDDLADGGAAAVAATIAAIRNRCPDTRVEVLISDMRGDSDALDLVIDARPDVFNHNIETVPRLQRAVRPSAGYARSLAVLARAKQAGLITKTSIIVGMGERPDEVEATLADLAATGTDIVTIGQYLRPTTNHVPIDRWWHPDEFASLATIGHELGIGHVEAGPLTRTAASLLSSSHRDLRTTRSLRSAERRRSTSSYRGTSRAEPDLDVATTSHRGLPDVWTAIPPRRLDSPR